LGISPTPTQSPSPFNWNSLMTSITPTPSKSPTPSFSPSSIIY
jgi:hypothetical protein